MKNKYAYITASAVSALLLTLASPGYDLWFLAYVAFIPALVAAEKYERPGLILWIMGFLYYSFNLRWVETSISVFGGAPSFIGYLAACALGAFLALFWAVFGRVYKRKTGSCLLAAVVFVCLEVVKGSLLGGFPWLNLSHTQYKFPAAIQIAELGGEYLVSFVIIYFNIALAGFITRRQKNPAAIAVITLAACFSYGFIAMHRHYDVQHTVRTRILQPDYKQSDKWDPFKDFEIFYKVNEMVRASSPASYDLLVLPESVYPHFMSEDFSGYQLLSVISDTTPVIAGGIRYDQDKKGKSQYFNSVFMFDKGQVSTYDKRHLVPFGEYFPLGGIFKPIDYYFFKGAEDFSAGSEPTVFKSGLFTAAPLVCYESAYSRLVQPQIDNGADMITVVTNDSWFGKTQGSYQHVAEEVLRSVEFRRSVVRAAQTGVSACIEPTGQIQAELGAGKAGYLDCRVRTLNVKTLYASAGYIWLIVFIALAVYLERKKRV